MPPDFQPPGDIKSYLKSGSHVQRARVGQSVADGWTIASALLLTDARLTWAA